MNAPLQPSASRSAVPSPREGQYSPSVPISVYRELATELKATQAVVDSLTQQNHQLTQQNQSLRHELLRFVDAAAQLKQTLVSTPTIAPIPDLPLSNLVGSFDLPLAEPPTAPAAPASSRLSEAVGGGVNQIAHQVSQIIKPNASQPKAKGGDKVPKTPAPKTPVPKAPRPVPNDRVLYTEERLTPSRPGQSQGQSPELSGLWLATTILLVVFSAFGAGFLIMKPLLNNSR